MAFEKDYTADYAAIGKRLQETLDHWPASRSEGRDLIPLLEDCQMVNYAAVGRDKHPTWNVAHKPRGEIHADAQAFQRAPVSSFVLWCNQCNERRRTRTPGCL